VHQHKTDIVYICLMRRIARRRRMYRRNARRREVQFCERTRIDTGAARPSVNESPDLHRVRNELLRAAEGLSSGLAYANQYVQKRAAGRDLER
jgi:hypothetical protein